MPTTYPQIPYGWADFEAIRTEHCLYVDKTRFLHELENERYAFLIRPRTVKRAAWCGAEFRSDFVGFRAARTLSS